MMPYQKRKPTSLLLFLILSGLLPLAGASTSNAARTQEQTQTKGRLVIIGGGLKSETKAIYQAFLEGVPDDASVGVVPLASGVPEESGSLTVKDIQQYADTSTNVVNIPLIHTQPEYASTLECRDQLAACRGLWFTGGDQNRIIRVLRPNRGDTRSYQSIRKLLADGGCIAGTSAGAAMMSDRMIRGGSSEEAMLFGCTQQDDGSGVIIGKGMELFPYGIVDQHFLRRARFGRLLVAVEAEGSGVGFGISENCAILVDLSRHSVQGIGNEAVTVIDTRNAQKSGHQRNNIRLSLLGNGDVYDCKSHTLASVADKQTLKTPHRDTGLSIRFSKMWDAFTVREMIKTLAVNSTQPVLSYDSAFEYIISADKQTNFYVGNETPSLTAVGIRLDIVPRKDIEAYIEKQRTTSSRQK